MTQVCPVLGVAPSPTLVSVICKPDGMVMVFPVVSAITFEGAPEKTMPADVMPSASAIKTPARWVTLILGFLLVFWMALVRAACLAAPKERSRLFLPSPPPHPSCQIAAAAPNKTRIEFQPGWNNHATDLTPDLCVIGAGSGGLSAAAIAGAFGVPVVLVERARWAGSA